MTNSPESLIDRLQKLANHIYELDSGSGEAQLLGEAINALRAPQINTSEKSHVERFLANEQYDEGALADEMEAIEAREADYQRGWKDGWDRAKEDNSTNTSVNQVEVLDIIKEAIAEAHEGLCAKYDVAEECYDRIKPYLVQTKAINTPLIPHTGVWIWNKEANELRMASAYLEGHWVSDKDYQTKASGEFIEKPLQVDKLNQTLIEKLRAVADYDTPESEGKTVSIEKIEEIIRQHEANGRKPRDVAYAYKKWADEEAYKLPSMVNSQIAFEAGWAACGFPSEIRLLTARLKSDIADNITIEGRSKTDVVQDIYDEFKERGLLKSVCGTCNGNGMIGGFVNAESGYDSENCPECTPKREMGNGWQPIETAPKDGTVIDLYGNNKHNLDFSERGSDAFWDIEKNEWSYWYIGSDGYEIKKGFDKEWEWKYWMPLPNSPAKKKKGKWKCSNPHCGAIYFYDSKICSSCKSDMSEYVTYEIEVEKTMKMNQKGKGQDDYQTPIFLYDHLNAMFKFELDAACTNANCLAPNGIYHDDGLDGLTESWGDNRVFCNPPFSTKDVWIKKAHDEVLFGECPIVVMVLPTLSMTIDAFHQYIHGKFFYQFSYSRYSFIDPATGFPQEGNNSGTTIVYFMKPLPRQVEVRKFNKSKGGS